MGDARYSDSSILIGNWRDLYPPDVFPGVWDFTADLITRGTALISEEVHVELQEKDDDLLAWVQEREHLIVPTDAAVQGQARDSNDGFPTLVDVERERSVADPFVISVAQINRCAVVTYEKRRTRPTKPHKIPDVCDELGIECIDFIQLARREGFRL